MTNFTKPITFTGSLAQNVTAFLKHYDCPHTAAHCGDVAAEARRIALQMDVNADKAETAGWLHDVSAIIPAADRVEVAGKWGLEVLSEEASYPMIIHQKLSVVLAQEIFNLHDAEILSAIGCHTTLKHTPAC